MLYGGQGLKQPPERAIHCSGALLTVNSMAIGLITNTEVFMKEIHVLSDIDSISQAVAEKWRVLSEQAISGHGGFHIALSGGTTPRRLFEFLATSDYSKRIDWSRVHIYFGDERSVPADHEDSNFKMASDALLDRVKVPGSQVYRMPADADDIQKAAEEYSSLLKNKLPVSDDGQVQFDLVLLGMGDDGHTASLFPGTTILEETDKLVSAVYVDKMATWRMSLTFPVINNARNIALLVAGENKKEILEKVLDDTSVAPTYPVQMIRARGNIDWYIDAAAAPSV